MLKFIELGNKMKNLKLYLKKGIEKDSSDILLFCFYRSYFFHSFNTGKSRQHLVAILVSRQDSSDFVTISDDIREKQKQIETILCLLAERSLSIEQILDGLGFTIERRTLQESSYADSSSD
ncbi:hypothetical protein [Sphingobacterium sp. JB170]|uniref:hypothetical protein n=1 Tax=Sphingobacterium sp. JB170 TaxID=1434842 RepID=UPI000B354372|nr:hypothetical protein [Sphingobacterium sp. JB170]